MAFKIRQHIINRINEIFPKIKLKPNDFLLKNSANVNLILAAKANDETEFFDKIHNKFKCDNIILNVKKNDLDPKPPSICFEIDRKKAFSHILTEIIESPYVYKSVTKEKQVIEFSSPNICKPFHMGHLRSTILGNFFSNLSEYLGNDVIRLNYLGDWGTQFGYLNLGIDLLGMPVKRDETMKKLYEAYVYANHLSETDETIKQKAIEIFNRLELNDDKLMKRWDILKEMTVKELEKTYSRLGVAFTYYHWESMYGVKHINKIIDDLKKKESLVEENGRLVIRDLNTNNTVSILKSNGSSLYITRDIAAAIDRYDKFKFDKMYYVVDNTQAQHFSNLFQILNEKLNLNWSTNLYHIKFGRVLGMSTRKGNAVFLNDILDEIRQRMIAKQLQTKTTKVTKEKIEEYTSDLLGISCVLINDLKQRRQKDYYFDWNNALQTDGDTGSKLQYTHCRLYSLEVINKVLMDELVSLNKIDLDSLIHEMEINELMLDLIISISQFSDCLFKTNQQLEPCVLVKYLFSLCNKVSRALKTESVKNETNKLKAMQRLFLFHKARLVLNDSMKILGLRPLNQM